MHKNAITLFKKFALEYFQSGYEVLEIGPDAYPSSLQKIVLENQENISWDCLELEESFHNLDCNFSSVNKKQINIITGDPYSFPIANEKYDVVLSAFVIEHVPVIWDWIKEVNRITKKGGYVITIAPTSWPYHEAPVDCWRIYPEGMKALYENARLEIITCTNECNEINITKRHYPGWTNADSWKNKLKAFIGWPLPAAYDTIAIGLKV